MLLVLLAALSHAGCDAENSLPQWMASSAAPVSTPHLVLENWAEAASVAEGAGRLVTLTADVRNTGPATYENGSAFELWNLPAGVELRARSLAFGEVGPAAVASPIQTVDVFVPTASESAFQVFVAAGPDGVMRGKERLMGVVTPKPIDDATLDLYLRNDGDTLVFSGSTAYLDGLAAGDFVVSSDSTELPRPVPAPCALFPFEVAAVSSFGDEVFVTPSADAPLVYESGDSVVNLQMGFDDAVRLTRDGGTDVVVTAWDEGPADASVVDFPGATETSPLIRFAVPDFEPTPGVVVSGDILLEKLSMPSALRFRNGDVEFDAEPTLEWRFIGSITAETEAQLDHSAQLGSVLIDLARIPAGVTNLSLRLELQLTVEVQADVVAGATAGVDIRGRQAAVVHIDTGGGSFSKSLRSATRLDATPPRLTEDTYATAGLGVGSSIGVSVSDTYSLLRMTYAVEGKAMGEVSIDPSANPAVQSGTSTSVATALTATIVGFDVELARNELVGSNLEPIAAPLETPPTGGPAGRGYAQRWATVVDGWGTGAGIPTDLSGDLLVAERDGAGITTYLTAFDRDGQVRWESTLPDFGGNVDALSDGGAVHFAGRIQRVDDQGELLWSWQRPDYSTLYSPAVAVAERDDGTDDIWTAHRYNTVKKERIARHDPDTGEPLFYRELTADGGLVIWNMLADGHGAVLCGRSNQAPLSQGRINDAVVIRLDRDGEVAWARKTSGEPWGCAVRQDGSGSVLVFGRNAPEYYEPHEASWAAEYDVDGNLVWHRSYALTGTIPGQGTVDRWSGPHLLDEVNVAAPMADGWMLAGTTGYLEGQAVFTLAVNRLGDPLAARVIDGVGVTEVRGLHQRGDAFLLALTSPTPGPLVQSAEDVQVLAMMPHDGRIVFDPSVGLSSYAVDVVADDFGGDAGIWGVYETLDLPLVVAIADVAEPWTERNDSLLAPSVTPVADGTWAPPCGLPCEPVDTGDTGDTGMIDTGDTGGADTGDTGVVDTGDTGGIDTGDTGPTDTGAVDTGTSDTGSSDTGSSADTGVAADSGGEQDPPEDDAGPRCSTTPGAAFALMWVPMLALRRRR
ncbi:MAG: hypothetical protein KC912_22980 [Proteobacteria bacterium]|nr:hypothetical protein [Pseudomonadota bacterium]